MTKAFNTHVSLRIADDEFDSAFELFDLGAPAPTPAATALTAAAAPAPAVAVVHGTAGNDTIIGTAGDDWIMGDDGNDSIDGGNGNDNLYGGNGNDFLRGGAGVDKLDGGEGNDVLDGGLGADRMAGGRGNDVYVVDSIFDQVLEGVGEGEDTVQTAMQLYTLDANIERLTFLGNIAHTGNGNALNNNITGGFQGDVLRGMDGSDFLNGMQGNDTLDGGNGGDILYGGTGNDVLLGGAGGDQMYGEDGDDRLDGGAGSDLLYGGAGDDRFVFTTAATGSNDYVADFVHGHDKVDFSAIDGNAAVAGRQALAFSFQGAFVGGGVGSVNYSFTSNGTVLHVDANGDGQSDFDVTLSGQQFFVGLSDLVL